MKSIAEITKNMTDWQPPVIPENIAHGDMPGDKVEIGEGHVQKANVIFKELLPMLEEASEKSETGKVVITVCGGSGVGKSEIASLLSFYLKEAGIGSYTLSGDNYPHRIPVYNDAERLHTFREMCIRDRLWYVQFILWFRLLILWKHLEDLLSVKIGRAHV